MFDAENQIRCVVDDQIESVFDAIVGLASKRAEGIPLFAAQVADETVTDVLMWIISQLEHPPENWIRMKAQGEVENAEDR